MKLWPIQFWSPMNFYRVFFLSEKLPKTLGFQCIQLTYSQYSSLSKIFKGSDTNVLMLLPLLFLTPELNQVIAAVIMTHKPRRELAKLLNVKRREKASLSLFQKLKQNYFLTKPFHDSYLTACLLAERKKSMSVRGNHMKGIILQTVLVGFNLSNGLVNFTQL